MSRQIKVGDTLWSDDDNGRRAWTELPIVSETKLSWIVCEKRYASIPHMQSKVNKKTMLESLGRYGNKRWYTAAQKAARDWRQEHAGPICQRVQFATEDQLREIAKIVGYDPEAKS